jgi:hypothetical protein
MKRFGTLFVIYLALYFVLTYPSGARFSSVLLADQGDGFQNVWNIWWVNLSLFHLHASPMFTRFLFFPEGASLLGHTISLTNTVPSAALAMLFSPATAYNVWLILGFVLGGVFTYYLCLELGVSSIAAFAGGYLFTFSEYHFSHATGHFQLVAIQWIPLFLWAWFRLLESPSLTRAVWAAGTFLLVLFADYYYGLSVIVAGGMALACRLLLDFRFIRNRRLWISIGVFALIVLAAAGPFVWSTAVFLRAPFSGAHTSSEFGADLLSPWIPGAFWRFGSITKPLWSTFGPPPVEGSTYLGWSALLLTAMGFRRKQDWRRWTLLAAGAVFLILSFGPEMRLAGTTIRGVFGPYHHLETIARFLRYGGVPARLSVITVLAVAVLASLGVDELLRRSRYVLLCFLLLLGVVELAPSPLPNTPVNIPPFFESMKRLPRDYAVLDRTTTLPLPNRMYYQTRFELPTSGGYISREPQAVTQAEASIQALAQQGEWSHLCRDLGFRYVLFSSTDPVPAMLEGQSPMLEGDGFRLFDLDRFGPCKVTPPGS